MNQQMPVHMGVILDGNRRWAKHAGKKALEGHRVGAEVFKETSLHLFERGVRYVSGYIFSTENWQRKADEVDYLMRLVIKAVELHLDEYNKKGIRVRVLGSRDNLDSKVVQAIERTESKTVKNDQGTLALCFNYGGHDEIVQATKQIVEGGVLAEGITADTIAEKLYAPDIPDIDLIVRTSGEQRLSGFMMWRAQYAELEFVQKLWPDMTTADFDTILKSYAERERRFGC